MIARLLRAKGQVIGVDADAVAADEAGVKLMKFHLVAAAESTSPVSMSSWWKTAESSFMKAMLRSRCAFSITLAASATFIEGALCRPAVTTEPYTAATMSSVRAS